ncbi:hypothetical protein C5167_039656 [Papaver somniferum]|uniref:Uncharacterized protein n=1 Tax=Papaver somniferum TaxID=3469 RepID=A0A4Y7IGZ0_PAPSO|nr:hypothetical protein C5167_039656 [Papaver somniferum]
MFQKLDLQQQRFGKTNRRQSKTTNSAAFIGIKEFSKDIVLLHDVMAGVHNKKR